MCLSIKMWRLVALLCLFGVWIGKCEEISKKEEKDDPGRSVTEDSIVLEAQEEPRQARALVAFRGWGELLGAGGGGPCLTSKGHLGACTSFKQCYPYFKLPILGMWESWVLGNYDTCSYFNDQDRQAFGVCCTNPVTPTPIDTTTETTTPPNEPIVEESSNESEELPVPSPNNPASQYPNWPPPIPPIPTHPPDHTPATHPPSFALPGSPTVQPVVTTWPTRPTGSVTLFPSVSYPPILITHPPVTSRPTTQKPTRPPYPVAPVATVPPVTSAECGSKNGYQDQERIVGGQNADIGEWPWIAVLFNSGRQFCGGSLIDSTHVLTAAHCVAHMSSWDVARITVRLGEHNIRTNAETNHIEKRVKRVVRHRGFDSRTLYNDVAVLTLDSPVQFTQQIRPICLPSGGAAGGGRGYAGQTATVIGWGSIRESGPQPSVLQEVTVPIWTNTECRQKYGVAAPGGIVDHMICAGQSSRDSCSGDSGGPLMVNEGRWTQVGIVSWGIGCGKGQYPGVYSRVTHFLPWITKNTKQH